MGEPCRIIIRWLIFAKRLYSYKRFAKMSHLIIILQGSPIWRVNFFDN